MNQTSTPAAVPKKKGGAGKTFLSVVFFILILVCAYVLAKCMSLGAVNQTSAGRELLSESNAFLDGALSGIIDSFLVKPLGFWCAISAVVLWFGLWIVTTKRVASAIRGLGVACSIAALVQLAGGLTVLLLTGVFAVDGNLLAYSDVLPDLFADTCGDVVIFALASLIIAAFGIFICKLRKLPKKNQTVNDVAAPVVEPIPVPVADSVPEPVAAAAAVPQPEPSQITDIDISVSEPAAVPQPEPPQITDIDINVSEPAAVPQPGNLAGVCHMCGTKNDTNVKFCGSCGAKLL